MLFAEKEINLINSFQNLESDEILLLPEDEEVKEILHYIYDAKKWEEWIDSSSKDAPPPDFYSDKYKLMMEVMRVDDHGYKKKGKIINPTYEKEHLIEKELSENGILDMFPNATLNIIADTKLPTEEDHNYDYYLDNFKRTVENHIRKIHKYRNNHIGYKLIFFVYDESSAYFEALGDCKDSNIVKRGKPHFFMLDEAFLDVFYWAKIDYLIWYAPYKKFYSIDSEITLPKACVYRIGEPLPKEYIYDKKKMMSVER